MDAQSNLTTKTTQLVASLSSLIRAQGKPVLMPSELRSLLSDSLPKGITFKGVQRILEQSGMIHQKTLKSDDYKDVKRIVVPSLDPTPYHYALSLRGDAYLSHGSAVHLLGLTQQQPKTIYVNKEQGAKAPSDRTLSQESINRAFSRPQRRSNYVYRADGFQIVLLSGKATGHAGVVNDRTTGLPITSLERTLIDIAVRPRYAGGVFQVSQAYKQALNDIEISKLISLLKILNHRYPYHQALGFYLEHAGANDSMLNPLRQLGILFDFYIDYSMDSPAFDQSWRVFYPLGV